MDKYSLFPGTRPDGRPNIHLIEPGSAHGLNESAGLDKTASGEHLPEVIELVESLSPQPDRLYLVNSALGAGEFVGFNLRGDWFTEEGLLHTPPGWSDIPVWDVERRRRAANWAESVPGWGELNWGFPTFYNAHKFRHHQNKDPKRAYGLVLGAFWDPRMRRVVLVSELLKSWCVERGAGDLYTRISQGEFPDTSMGARVPYDICSICGNLARTPDRYCTHVHKNAMPPYGMRSILPDGRMCGVYNTHPRFFDDSYVFVGAEKSAKVMSNMTHRVRGERVYNQQLFPHVPALAKTAEWGDAHQNAPWGAMGAESPIQQKEQALNAAAKDIFAVPAPDDTLEQKLSRMLSGLPLTYGLDREILRFLHDQEKGRGRTKTGRLSEKDFQVWQAMELKKLREAGVTPEDILRVQQSVKAKIGDLASKTASTTKWAEILKTIPAQPENLSSIRKHERCLPDLPDPVLNYLAEDPGTRFRAMARLGVILRPHEFQYGMLQGSYPDEALSYRSQNRVFAPAPVGIDMEPRYSAEGPLPEGMLTSIVSLLGGLLGQRSFAPSVIRVRISREPAQAWETYNVPHKDPLLDKVASLYNEYRAGLASSPPDWRSVPAETPSFSGSLQDDEKSVATAQQLSTDLLRLAYWPALPVG